MGWTKGGGLFELMLVAVFLAQIAILTVVLRHRHDGNDQPQSTDQTATDVDASLVPARPALATAAASTDADDHAAVEALLNDEELAFQLDRSDPFMHLRFATQLPPGASTVDDPNFTRLMSSLGDVLPLLPRGLPDGYMVARFAPDVAAMLNSGQARLMVSQGQELMKAVSTTTGRNVGAARRVAETGAGIGAVALGPIGVLVAGTVIVASWHHQRWVDRTLGRLVRSSAALEIRSRDDDFGVLHAGADAAERYLDVIEFTRTTPPVVLQELATAALDVNKLYHARIRRVHAFLAALDQFQDDHEQRTGQAIAWSKGVERLLSDGDAFLTDAIIAVHAAMVRAKLQALTSIELALEGKPAKAQQHLIDVLDACNNEVHSLRRRTHALARSQPRLAAVRSKARHAADAMGRLEDFFDTGVLDSLPDRVEPDVALEFVIPVSALQPNK